MNLSLLEQAVNTFLDGYWPKEVVEDWRYKKLFAASEAALAQQAQPRCAHGLTAGEIHDYRPKGSSVFVRCPGPAPQSEPESLVDEIMATIRSAGRAVQPEPEDALADRVNRIRERLADCWYDDKGGDEIIDDLTTLMDAAAALRAVSQPTREHSLVDEYPELAAVSRRRLEAVALPTTEQINENAQHVMTDDPSVAFRAGVHWVLALIGKSEAKP